MPTSVPLNTLENDRDGFFLLCPQTICNAHRFCTDRPLAPSCVRETDAAKSSHRKRRCHEWIGESVEVREAADQCRTLRSFHAARVAGCSTVCDFRSRQGRERLRGLLPRQALVRERERVLVVRQLPCAATDWELAACFVHVSEERAVAIARRWKQSSCCGCTLRSNRNLNSSGSCRRQRSNRTCRTIFGFGCGVRHAYSGTLG